MNLEEDYLPPDVGAGTNLTHYTYNLDKQLTQIARPDGQTVSFGYDAGGRLSTVTSPRGTVGYAYHATKGTLTSITSPDGATLTYAYDGFLPTSETSSGNISGSVSWTYDNDFRVTSEKVNGSNTANFAYDADGLLTAAGSLTLARNAQNGLLTGTSLSSSGTTQSYNSFGEVAQFTANQGASTVLGINYQRDDLGRIIQKTETIGGLTDTYAYGYDGAGRLSLVGKNGTTTASYAYDANGNRLSRTTPTTTETGTYDAQDRLLTYGTKTYTYTANGELSTKTDTATSQATQYTYDALGNLNTVLLPDGRRIDYLVDGRNRRVAKKVNGAFTKKFLYGDQLRIAAELNASNAVVSRFVYATRVNVPDYMVKGSITYRIVTDHLGSPRLVIDVSTGTIAQRLDYDEFGRVILDTNPGFQPFGFAGGLYDSDTGLVQFGARDYDAEAGRWMGKDPIRFGSSETGLYTYATSDPVNMIDLKGLEGYWSRVASDFATTNTAIPGQFAPTGLGVALGAGNAAASDLGWITLSQWIGQGFGAVTVGATTWTGIESAIITTAVSTMGYAAVSVSYEAGVGVGSLLSALPLYGGGTLGDFYGEQLYNLYLNKTSRTGLCNNDNK